MIRFFGLYRGVVKVRRDPKGRGRIRVSIPAVYGKALSPWCLPCVDHAGVVPHAGYIFMPCLHTGVWIMFEQGDPNKPVWMGQWLGNIHANPNVDPIECEEELPPE